MPRVQLLIRPSAASFSRSSSTAVADDANTLTSPGSNPGSIAGRSRPRPDEGVQVGRLHPSLVVRDRPPLRPAHLDGAGIARRAQCRVSELEHRDIVGAIRICNPDAVKRYAEVLALCGACCRPCRGICFDHGNVGRAGAEFFRKGLLVGSGSLPAHPERGRGRGPGWFAQATGEGSARRLHKGGRHRPDPSKGPVPPDEVGQGVVASARTRISLSGAPYEAAL
jgi:hypothetical protein